MNSSPIGKLIRWWGELTKQMSLDEISEKILTVIGPMASVAAIATALCFLLMLLYRGVRKVFVKVLVYLTAIVAVVSALLWRFVWVEAVGYAPYGTSEELLFAAPWIFVVIFCLWMCLLCRNHEKAARKKLEREQAAQQRKAEAAQRAEEAAAMAELRRAEAALLAEQRRADSAQRRNELVNQAAQFMKPLDDAAPAETPAEADGSSYAVVFGASRPAAQPVIPATPVIMPVVDNNDVDVLRHLKQLNELKKAGLVTEQEYETKKQALIRQL